MPASLSAGSVDVVVTTGAGATPARTFLVDVAALVKPLMVKISPTRGKAGVVMTISGQGFGTRRGASKVLFGTKVVVKYYWWSATRIKVKVPPIGRGKIAVKVRASGGTSNVKYFARI